MRLTIGAPLRLNSKSSQVDPLSWYCSKISMDAPNRTTWLDSNQAAKLQMHKTQSDLRRTVKRSTIPHISYDIDGDGIVTQKDMRVAREVDRDAAGVLNTERQTKGKEMLVREFLEENQVILL